MSFHRMLILLLLSILLLGVGCASNRGHAGARQFLSEEADFGYYETVGVIPFSNLSNDRAASDKVTAAFVTELLIGEHVQVITMGDLVQAIRTVIKDDRISMLDNLSVTEARAIGEAAKVQGIFVGAVKDYGMVRSGSEDFPLVGVIVRFIDCQTGKVVWTYDVTRKGGPKFPLLSIGETHTLGQMTTKVMREMASGFSKATK